MRYTPDEDTHRGVALLGLASLAGEDDKASLVGVQSLNVELLSLLAEIPAPVVDDDTDTTSLLLSDSGLLELSESESTSLPQLAVVSHGLSTNGWAERCDGADTESSRLGLAGCATTELASWLIEPGANSALPVLTEMVIVEDVVVSETHVLT